MTDETSQLISEMPKRNPTNGTFELTVRCNLRCKMCLFRHDDSENRGIIEKELSAEQWIDMARQVAKSGTMSLLITGGEPMLRSDFCEIWEGIYKLGFVMELYTNATLVTPKIMDKLKKYPPHKIGVSIYGASPETYEKVCGNAAAFGKMLAGGKMLSTLPSILEFRTTLIEDNYRDLSDIGLLVKENFGKTYEVTVSSEVYQPVRGACGDVSTCRLSPEKMWQICIGKIYESAKEIMGESFDPNALKLSINDASIHNKGHSTQKLSLFGCKAGMDSYTISWDGKLLACQMLETFSSQIQEKGFAYAWERFPFKVKLPPQDSKCVHCDVARFCYSCYASHFAETGKLNGCSNYIREKAIVNKKYFEKLKEKQK